ncbi:MAG: fumarylacetoacetate hydrolase family protein [Lentisphaeria bacterium]|nr:fumarylacetoacetate hydrolase family protein [Lentisphaeria bacterium]
MKLATVKNDTPDGQLVLVSHDHSLGVVVPEPYATMAAAIADWGNAKAVFESLSAGLQEQSADCIKLEDAMFMAPLPRTWAWLDGSAFIHHIVLIRKARNAPLPEELYERPLMYQGISDQSLGPFDDIKLIDESYGLDFEGEVSVIVDDVPAGISETDAAGHIKLLVLMNDVSLRNLIPAEVKTGFGFIQSKPKSAYAPFAVSPDELGSAWKDSKVHLALSTRYNNEFFGHVNGDEMYFSFSQLIAHAAKTRDLSAGTIIGSGTFSNESEDSGFSCIAEQRMIEKIETGEMKTPFMKIGDRVEMEMLNGDQSIFGKINQIVS